MLHSANQEPQNTLSLKKKDKPINHEYNVSLSKLHPQCVKENIAIISNEATDKAVNQIVEFEKKQQMKKERQEQFAKQIEQNAKKIQSLNRQKKVEQERKKEEEKQKILNRSKVSSLAGKNQTSQEKKKFKQQIETQKIEPLKQLQIQEQVLIEDEAGNLSFLIKLMPGQTETPILEVPAPTLQQLEFEKQEPQRQQVEMNENDQSEEEEEEEEMMEEARNFENEVDIEGVIYKQPNPLSAQIMIVQEAESEEEDEIQLIDPDEVVEQVQSIRERLRAYRM